MGTPNQPPTAQPSEVDAFTTDYDEIINIIQARPGHIEATTTDDADRFAVVADNFVSCMNLAQGLGALLDRRNHEGSYVVYRALYESSINLMYLYDVGDRTHNALLARAYALLEMTQAYREAGAHEASVEYHKVYDKMPKSVRDELKKNRKKVPHHWSGVTLPDRAALVGFTGHRIMYRGTSWEAHALALGRLAFETIDKDRHVLTMNRSLDEVDAEIIARMSRQCLRQVWKRFSTEAYGTPVELTAPPPNTTPRSR